MMITDTAALIQDALDLDAAHAAISDTATIIFDETYRAACEKNRCGSYNTSWMGPPAVGPISECKKKVLEFKQGLLFQTIYVRESTRTFDYKGMVEGAKLHDQTFRKILAMMRTKYSFSRIFPLNAGCCHLCQRCAYLDDEPCRLPDQAVASVEAFGIDVMRMEVAAGIPYYNGKGTYSFVGLILFEE
jgi:predicted metal-binding protein